MVAKAEEFLALVVSVCRLWGQSGASTVRYGVSRKLWRSVAGIGLWRQQLLGLKGVIDSWR